MLKSLLFTIFSVFLIVSLFFVGNTTSSASSFGKLYVLFERMQVNSNTDIIIMISTESDFGTGSELKITFLSDIGDWCLDESSIDVFGVDSSALDVSNWSIDFALPTETSLEAYCLPGDPNLDVYDSIVIENIAELDQGVNYAVLLEQNPNFKTSSVVGGKEVLVNLNDGENQIAQEISINLIDSDSINLTAFVSDVSTITCSISDSVISFDSLPRDGSYSVTEMSLSTQSSLSNGHYWAVYGQGDGNEAGLWKSSPPTSLIPSSGSSTINLSQSHGFGLRVSSMSGNIPTDFNNLSPAVFGAINSGSLASRVIYFNHAASSTNLNITLGARAGLATEVGPHTETLTYLCGGLY